MIFGSVCSGVEAATVAWHPLGWEPAWFCENDDFPSAVLAHHYPDVPNLGDMHTIHERKEYGRPIDVLVGGTPCQSFSIAGLRKGLDDDRGNLALKFCQILQQLQPRWFIWENVTGVLSNNEGRDFGSILDGFSKCGYQYGYRVLDAVHYGVPQGRRRVFVVGHLGDWRAACAVLFERESLRGDPAPCGKQREELARRLVEGAEGEITEPIVIDRAAYNQGANAQFDIKIEHSEVMSTLTARGPHAVAYSVRTAHTGSNGIGVCANAMHTLDTSMSLAVAHKEKGEMIIRRLLPVECERLMGFPDDYTKIPYKGKPASKCPDGARWKAMGNSIAVPVIKKLGQKIQRYEDLIGGKK